MILIPPIINGQNFAWSDVGLMLFGTTPVIGIASIDYEENADMEDNYGAGAFPIGQGIGQFKYKGSIELFREEMVPIIASAPQGKIQLIPAFPIKVTYGNDSQALQVNTLKFCRFMNNPFSSKSGDKKITGKINLLIGDIDWQG